MARKGRKRKTHKVGDSWTAMRKVSGKRRRVRVKKIGKNKYKVHVISKKRTRRRRRRR
jgi:hypothetical protein